ncbi:MAG: magnesium/cobalt transporter CorA [Candidatus Lokiarchaeota archaeon]|nr:magnesium/cobalt transporter CorA [Candidatus Lokiarchaeota archaeon]
MSIFRKSIKLLRKRNKKIGLPPGTLIYTGERKPEQEKVTIIDYNDKKIDIRELKELKINLKETEKEFVRWINITGLGQMEVIEELGRQFDLHPLLLEDVLNPDQRPKIENYGNFLFLILNIIWWDNKEKNIQSEQVSLILGKSYVMTFREFENDLFFPIVDRLKQAKGRIRKMEEDYLLYSLIDIIIDNYFVIIEKIGNKIDKIEEDLIDNPTINTLQEIHSLRREVITLRKSIWPSRSVINSLQREEAFIKDSTQIYLRDIYDHIIQIIDNFENFRDIISSLLDIYLSSVSNKMNEVMKVLTIISTTFIPISFLAGFYGMNFTHMPELSSLYGYPILISIMIIIALIMLMYFKRRRWI